MADFTGQNIQDTYQRVVQVDGNQLQDGTGSNLPISFNGDDVIIPGTLRANSYVVSQSTVVVSSGSTIFGNSFDDTHTFSGSVNIQDRVNTDHNAITPALFVRQDAEDRSQIANGFGGSIDFHTQRGSSANGARSGRIANRLTTGAQSSADYYALDFGIRSNDTQIDLMTLHSDSSNTAGRVGILDTTPSYTLDVNGTFRATGDINAGGNIVGDQATTISGINTIAATGNISSSGGTVSGVTLKTDDYLVGDTNQPTGLLVAGYVKATSITASSDISSSGNIGAEGYYVDGYAGLTYSTTDLYIGNANYWNSIRYGRQESDHHDFIGSVTASSHISASGDLFGDNLTIASVTTTDRLVVDQIDEKNTGKGITFMSGNITASSHISASGDILALRLVMDNNVVGAIGDGKFIIGNQSVPVEIKQNYLTVDPDGTNGHITASGNISASGTISGSKGHFVDGLTLGTRLNANQIGANGNVGNTEYGYLNGVTSAIQTQFDAKAPIANPSFTGTASFASHITASGDISASGTITANKYKRQKIVLACHAAGVSRGSLGSYAGDGREYIQGNTTWGWADRAWVGNYEDTPDSGFDPTKIHNAIVIPYDLTNIRADVQLESNRSNTDGSESGSFFLFKNRGGALITDTNSTITLEQVGMNSVPYDGANDGIRSYPMFSVSSSALIAGGNTNPISMSRGDLLYPFYKENVGLATGQARITFTITAEIV